MTDGEERELKVAVMQADLRLKGRQAFWETPRNLAILGGALAAIAGTLGGLVGFKIAQGGPQPVQIIFQPGSIVAAPAPVAAQPPAATIKK